ncbi:MAG: ribonuclease Z [Deltaproteobacteria bacterium]|nr:ribonuclease Z [Deltaproteobacteria bacterium]
MRPTFHPKLVNDPFHDPALFVQFLFENRAILFDLGDIVTLSTRDILKITHVFVTHTHMDHFIGFDHLLRVMLGRERRLSLFGPEGFLEKIEGKLSGYTWNLVDHYTNRLSICAVEARPDCRLIQVYECADRFIARNPPRREPFTPTIHEEPILKIETVILDHKIGCLAFRLKERFHINIRKQALAPLGLTVGPWIRDFKQALYNGQDLESDFIARHANETETDRVFKLGALSDEIAQITPGQEIVYIADVAGHLKNLEKIIPFSMGADHLYIEASFLDADRAIAHEKRHLTARIAGHIAKEAKVKQYTLFHFSPRYTGMADLLYQEAAEAFSSAHP